MTLEAKPAEACRVIQMKVQASATPLGAAFGRLW